MCDLKFKRSKVIHVLEKLWENKYVILYAYCVPHTKALESKYSS